jgi:kynurenine formamidase
MDDWYPSRYGAADRAGAANELTAERTLSALQIPRTGRVIELAQLTTAATPLIPPRAHHQLILAHESSGADGWQGENEFSALQEHVVISYHVGCHLDGLGHVGIGGRYYNGLTHAEIFTPTGLRELGIENVRPWLSRGVLLDVAGARGVDRLDAGYEITTDDLEAAADRASVGVGVGDVVVVHTGWSSLATSDPAAYAEREPGLGESAAAWLTDRRVSLIGLDNWGCDVYPNPDPRLFFPVHQQLLTRTGTYILENIQTAELVSSGAAEFLFVLTAPRHQGATAALVAPLAVI